jgi:hypothetical protein
VCQAPSGPHQVIHQYGFKSLESLKDYIDEYVIETPEELQTAMFNHFDMSASTEDCIKLLELVK